MTHLRALFFRLWNSAVVWSWAFNGLRVGSAVLLLPLLLRLPPKDFGFYGVLLSIVALAPLLDLGLLTSIDRALGYAMGGAAELKAHGFTPQLATNAGPNYPLLWKLLFTCRTLYRFFAVVTFFVLAGWGTYVVSLRVHESSHPSITWAAWGLTLVGAVFEMYSGWWNVYLRGLNEVLLCSRILVLAFSVRFVLSCALLYGGAGLLSVPMASFFSSFLQRNLSKRYCLQRLSAHPAVVPPRSEVLSLVRILWPNSWRTGVHYASSYLTVHANTFICFTVLGLAGNAVYFLSVQIIAVCQTMAGVWVSVKWPVLFQLRARQDMAAMRRVLQPRVWLNIATFTFLVVLAITCGPTLLQWSGSKTTLLPTLWLILLAGNTFLEGQFTIWATVILTENRLPFLWSTVMTGFLSLALVLCMIYLTPIGMGALVLGPLLAGCLFNYWFWVKEGARSLQTRWWRFTFSASH